MTIQHDSWQRKSLRNSMVIIFFNVIVWWECCNIAVGGETDTEKDQTQKSIRMVLGWWKTRRSPSDFEVHLSSPRMRIVSILRWIFCRHIETKKNVSTFYIEGVFFEDWLCFWKFSPAKFIILIHVDNIQIAHYRQATSRIIGSQKTKFLKASKGNRGSITLYASANYPLVEMN